MIFRFLLRISFFTKKFIPVHPRLLSAPWLLRMHSSQAFLPGTIPEATYLPSWLSTAFFPSGVHGLFSPENRNGGWVIDENMILSKYPYSNYNEVWVIWFAKTTCWRAPARQLPILYNKEKKAKTVGDEIGDLRSKFCFYIRGLLNVETCAVDYGCKWLHVEISIHFKQELLLQLTVSSKY